MFWFYIIIKLYLYSPSIVRPRGRLQIRWANDLDVAGKKRKRVAWCAGALHRAVGWHRLQMLMINCISFNFLWWLRAKGDRLDSLKKSSQEFLSFSKQSPVDSITGNKCQPLLSGKRQNTRWWLGNPLWTLFLKAYFIQNFLSHCYEYTMT